MSSYVLERRFAAIGARVRVPERGWHGVPAIDVGADGEGEYFDLRFPGVGPEVDVSVVDVAPAARHLLMLVRDGELKSKFLCGHDERHWFVAAVPEAARGVTGVASAMEALQPVAVRSQVERAGVRRKERFARRNAAFVRQGEWYFVPVPGRSFAADLVSRSEPLSRGAGSKPHVMEEAVRFGGQAVYVNASNGRVLSEARYLRLSEGQRRSGSWMRQVRDPEVYARGTVRHPDHATIVLRGWHRVLMNTEHSALAMRHVVFLD